MKVLKNILAATAALAMVGAPVVASAANPVARVSTVAKKSSKLEGGSTIIALLAAAAIIAGIAIAAGGSNSPKSP